MLVHFALFVAGLAVLYFGADWLVKGARDVAIRFGIRPLVVGLTIVALGTSMPEFLLNIFAVFKGEDGLAIGNIVGSNISNIALILGVSAVILPLVVGKAVLDREYPMMLGITILFYVLAFDGEVSRVDGFVLLVGLVAFFSYLIRDSKLNRALIRKQAKEAPDVFPDDPVPPTEPSAQSAEQAHSRPAVQFAFLMGGVIALALGAHLMVDSSVAIAEFFGIPSVVIGLTIVAVGTSLPELAASLVSVIRGDSDISVGNILGSNMLNVLFVVGLVAIIRPMQVEAGAVSVHFPVMIGITVLLYPLARKGYTISRAAGYVLLASFFAYTGWLVIPYL